MKEGGAEDAAIREGGRERGMLTHEESRGGGGGALERCRQVRGGCDRPCFWGRGMDISGDRAGDVERWLDDCIGGRMPKML